MKPSLYLINGPLGAGKTTVLRHLIADPFFAKARIIENEFASTSIDTAQLHDHQAEVQTIAGVCICCSTGNELVEALETLSGSSDPVIIEATGVANSLQLVEKLVIGDVLEKYNLAAALFVLDATESRDDALREYEDELRAADTVLITKLDLVDDDAKALINERLAQMGIQPVAVLYGTVDSKLFIDVTSHFLDYFMKFEGTVRAHDTNTAYSVLSLDRLIIPEAALTALWPRLVAEYGMRRMKGDIAINRQTFMHVEATPKQLHCTPVDEPVTPQLVLIGTRARVVSVSMFRTMLQEVQ